MVNDFPVAIDIAGEVAVAVVVGKVIEEILLAGLVPISGKLLLEVIPVNGHALGQLDSSQVADRWQNVHDRARLRLYCTRRNWELRLPLVLAVGLCPRGDERHTHATLVSPSLLPTEG